MEMMEPGGEGAFWRKCVTGAWLGWFIVSPHFLFPFLCFLCMDKKCNQLASRLLTALLGHEDSVLLEHKLKKQGLPS